MAGHGGSHRSLTARKRAAAGFDFTAAIRHLCVHACACVEDLSHIQMRHVAVGFRQARKPVAHGLQASLTPMRFEGGARESVRRGRRWITQRLVAADGHEILYLLNFYLPRFLDLPFDEKLTTIFHELWHISPEFDGDLRRHEGRCYIHGPKQDDFDAVAARIAKAWLAFHPPAELYAFLHDDFADLRARHGSVIGQRYTAPKLIPLGRA